MVKIIAEAGVNHNGSKKLAHELIDVAFESGADMVKFQTFTADSLSSKKAKKANYQTENIGSTKSQHEMLKELELSYDDFHELSEYCNKIGIEFISTPFDKNSLSFLSKELGLETIKIPSGEITNIPLLIEYGATRRKLILSTGMSTLGEIEEALGAIAFGLLNKSDDLSPNAFKAAYCSNEGQKILQNNVTLLHCTTEYPTPLNEINLNAMISMKTTFGLPVGYSDHSSGLVVPIAATAIGAEVIEKHFTLSRKLKGPDHLASLEPEELSSMVTSIRETEIALGSEIKFPQDSELKNLTVARKSIVTTTRIMKGEKFNEDNISIKRPGNGVHPREFWRFINKRAQRDYAADDIVDSL